MNLGIHFLRAGWRLSIPAFFCFLLAPISFVSAADYSSEKPLEVLKICADPYMLPYSNKEGEGLENRIAELFAEKLGTTLQYEWFPQRMGFIRNTLRAENTNGGCCKCDLVLSIPSGFELASPTKPYYTSHYVLVYAKGRGLDEVTKPKMLRDVVMNGKDINIGLSDMGPAQLWVFENDLMQYATPYQSQLGDARANHVDILIRDLIEGKIDVTIVWGPMAGYFAKKYSDEAELVMLRMTDDPTEPSMKFQYSISMGVRYGEPEWKAKVNQLIADNREEIKQILLDYGVPMVVE
ncbi:MAG: quinoprotein dehydrogenase-associated putative ABC transporter substrate-binding protein [Gammaproteobacteria bacterium]